MEDCIYVDIALIIKKLSLRMAKEKHIILPAFQGLYNAPHGAVRHHHLLVSLHASILKRKYEKNCTSGFMTDQLFKNFEKSTAGGGKL